jgi:acetyltransferase-like isoleucine patch superfamily enzyme
MHLAQPVNREGVLGKSKITVGRFTYGTQCLAIAHYDQGAPLAIGSFCSIAENVTIFLGGEHDHQNVSTYPFAHPRFFAQLGGEHLTPYSGTKGGVTIGHDVWIGKGATIMSGITVGDGAVIAANAHVVKDVEPYSIVGGNPAKHLKSRFDQNIVDLLMRLRWWDLPVEAIKEISNVLAAKPSQEVLSDLLTRYRPAMMERHLNE